MEEKARMAQPPTPGDTGSPPPRRRKLKVVPNPVGAAASEEAFPQSQARPPTALPSALPVPSALPKWPRPAAKPTDGMGAMAAAAYPSNVDVEALTRNLARLIEEGGRAVAAYLKPREDGTQKIGYSDEVADAMKTLGQ